MKIQTIRFGEIEFPDEVLLRFPEGILGFPNDQHYVLLEHDVEESPFKWLQSAESPELAFIVLDPLLIASNYPVMLDVDTARMIGAKDVSQCAYMSIVNVPASDPCRMSVNLKAPLVVNSQNRTGRQVILGTQTFSINEPVFPRLNERLSETAQVRHAISA